MEGFIVDLGHLDGAEAQVGSKDEEEDECTYVERLEVGSIWVLDELPRGKVLIRIFSDSPSKRKVHQKGSSIS